MAKSAVKSHTLRAHVAERIRRAILDGRYPPNSILSENELAEEYSISRTPIREAIRELSVRGLVRVLPKRGILVTELTTRDIIDLYQVREAFECFAVRLAVATLKSNDADGFLEDQRATESHIAAGDYMAAYRSSIKMHSRIVAITGNAKMRQVLDDLSDQVYRIGMLTLHHGRSETSIAEHARIIDAILSRDADRAASLMRDHLQSDRDVVLTEILGVNFTTTSERRAGSR